MGINQNSASNNFGHPRAVVVNRFLGTLDTFGASPIFIQQNPGDPADPQSDDTLADAIADCDDVDGAYGLPGTLTLLSDGTSYRLHACGVAPSAFAADEGVGTIGDYPPAILRVLRTPVGISLLGAAVVDDILVVLGVSLFGVLIGGGANRWCTHSGEQQENNDRQPCWQVGNPLYGHVGDLLLQ